jgi:hypothetical protein
MVPVIDVWVSEMWDTCSRKLVVNGAEARSMGGAKGRGCFGPISSAQGLHLPLEFLHMTWAGRERKKVEKE